VEEVVELAVDHAVDHFREWTLVGAGGCIVVMRRSASSIGVIILMKLDCTERRGFEVLFGTNRRLG
jgi:hypothetical protein